ncbi:MAG: hypothetical protein ACUVXI_15780 [bacterium]
MARITIDEEKLGEIVSAAIDKRLQEGRFISLDDVEAVRRSPAGAMLIIENDVQWLKANGATKEDIKELDGKIDGVAEELGGRIDGVSEGLGGRISSVEGRLSLLIGLYFALLALFGSVAVKVFFFIP